jgi:hypothetical protein
MADLDYSGLAAINNYFRRGNPIFPSGAGAPAIRKSSAGSLHVCREKMVCSSESFRKGGRKTGPRKRMSA